MDERSGQESGAEARSPGAELEALRREVERLRILASDDTGLLDAVLNQSPHGVLVCDTGGRLVLQNRAAERIWAGSASADGVADWGKYRAFHPDGRPFAPADWSMARCLTSGETVETEEVEFQRFDGTRGVLLGSCAPIRRTDGGLRGAISVFADITHFKEIERERAQLAAQLAVTVADLERANEETRAAWARAEAVRADLELLFRLTSALNRAPGLDQVLDPALDAITVALRVEHAALLLAEDGATRMRVAAGRGLAPELHADVEALVPFGPEMAAKEPLILEELSFASAREAGQVPAGARQGASLGAALLLPLVHGDKTLGAVVGLAPEPRAFSMREIELGESIAAQISSAVARKQVAEERERLIEQLSRTVQFSELVAGILAHDLRSPLTAILTNAQLALGRQPSEPLGRSLARIVASGSRMGRMIDQLLDLTRIRVGNGIGPDVRPADLTELSAHVVQELRDARPEALIELEVQGDAHGEWDPDRLAQVISNLAGNALEHGTPGAAVAIRVDGTASETVVLEVHNRGVVKAALLPVLFEPFKSGRRTAERSHGLGLGLHITQQIVDAHGGTVSVSSVEPTGTTVTVVLPRQASRGAERTAAPPNSAPTT